MFAAISGTETISLAEEENGSHVVRNSLTTPPMTSRSRACAGWLSSRRSQVMEASIGLGERDIYGKQGGETLSWFWRH
jgi:hypothetical protein